MLSKACVVGAYQRKLEEIAALGVELTVVVPPCWQDERGLIALERRFTKGYRMIVAPMRFNGHFHIHYYPSLAPILRDARPDVVHVDEEPWDYVTYRAVRSAMSVGAHPLFFSWQNLLRPYPPPFRWFARYVFRRCRHAIAGNADALAVLRAKGFGGSITVIPQFGVDPDIYKPSEPVGAAEPAGQPFVIGYAGRLIAAKGLDTLLRAAAGLGGNWRLRLAGSGPERKHLRQLAVQLHIQDRVILEPPFLSDQMPDFYRQLDLLVLPSRRARNWAEQFGRVLIEAMACGVPVIGSDTGEIPNTIGDAGLIFHVDDVAALSAQIERVRSDDSLRCQLKERGRARIVQKYTQSSVAKQTVELYELMQSE